MDIAFYLSAFVFCVSTCIAILVTWGYRQLGKLEDTPPITNHSPKVSIIFSALNEADTIEPALLSLLAINYPQLEIIAINDRSTDATPHILNRLAQQHSRLRVVHIDNLPPGWLGKNHALYQGAQLASGDYFIFTDADIHFEQSAIARAVNYAEGHRLDHLTLFFNLIARGSLLRLMLVNFTVSLMARMMPWRVATSKQHFMGVGGFNMMKRNAYEKIGGHKAIAMAVLDDVMLGKLIKNHDLTQQVLTAVSLVSVEWYSDAQAMIRGLQKNMFAAFNFQVVQLFILSCGLVMLRLWPWIGTIVCEGLARWINILGIAITLSAYARILVAYGWSCNALIWAPFVGVIELYIFWRSCIATIKRGGIEWRGTFYPVEDLKKFKL